MSNRFKITAAGCGAALLGLFLAACLALLVLGNRLVEPPGEAAALAPAAGPASPTPTATLTATPTASPSPTATPTLTPTASPTATPAPRIEHVVVISVDGLRPDALDQADAPVIDGLRLRGAYSDRAQAVLPSVTLVNHASMISGMAPDKHGISWNELETDLGLVNGPTVFSVAHQAGLRSALVAGKPKLEHLVLPGSVETFIYAGFLDRQVIDRVLPVIREGLPDILFIHLPDVDSAGHATGWMSQGQLLAIGHTDSLIGEVLAALEEGGYMERTLLILTSDHGGVGQAHGGSTPEHTTVPWLAVGPGVPAGLNLQQEIVAYDLAATMLYALNLPLPPQWDGRPVLEIFQKDDDCCNPDQTVRPGQNQAGAGPGGR